MNNGQVIKLADWRNERELTNQQHNSDKGFYLNKEKICDGEVTIFQTRKSGGIWHMRMYVADAEKYFQKSLRTRNYRSAKEKAQVEHAKILVNQNEGKAIFSPTLYKAVELYIAHRQKDVDRGEIVKDRLGTIKSQLKHLKNFLNAESRLDTFTAKALSDYQMYRRKVGAKDVTIANEQATINNFCLWAFDEGLHNTRRFQFPTISLRGTDKNAIRRATFTDDEYKACYKDLQTYCSAKQIKADKCDDADAFERHLFRSFFLIMANTMMRNGELYGLTWENVEQYEEDKKFALISVWADTSKTRKGAPFVARGYEHFERLKRLSRHTKKTDYVFTDWNGKRWHAKNRRRLDNQFHALMSRVGITDYMERNLKIYSLRHYGITKRIENGVTNMLQFASDNRTSAKQIENTYFHSTIKQSYKNAKLMNKKKE